jgi:hypothetical protein
MIHDVDDTLRALIERDVIDAGVDLSFEAPTKEWASRQNKPTISAFLYDIREDMVRRDVAPLPVYDETGQVVGRRPPPRRFRLSYLLTAWTQRPEDEHRLLSALLAGFLRSDRLPEELLAGSIADSPVPTVITLAIPPPRDRSLSEIWSSLGGELKPSIDLVVIAPIDPDRAFETGPPVGEAPLIRVSREDLEDVVDERQGRTT